MHYTACATHLAGVVRHSQHRHQRVEAQGCHPHGHHTLDRLAGRPCSTASGQRQAGTGGAHKDAHIAACGAGEGRWMLTY